MCTIGEVGDLYYLSMQPPTRSHMSVNTWRYRGGRDLFCNPDQRAPDGSGVGKMIAIYGQGNCSVEGITYRGRDVNCHPHDKLEVVSGYLMDRILGYLKDIIISCKGKELISVTSMSPLLVALLCRGLPVPRLMLIKHA
jgi:hypothetical protein